MQKKCLICGKHLAYFDAPVIDYPDHNGEHVQESIEPYYYCSECKMSFTEDEYNKIKKRIKHEVTAAFLKKLEEKEKKTKITLDVIEKYELFAVVYLITGYMFHTMNIFLQSGFVKVCAVLFFIFAGANSILMILFTLRGLSNKNKN